VPPILFGNGSDVLTFVEPPRADPHAGWCGSLGLALVGQPPATRLLECVIIFSENNLLNRLDIEFLYLEKPIAFFFGVIAKFKPSAQPA